MVTKQSNGALLSRGQETSAHCSQRFHSPKLFKMRLVNMHPTLFGEFLRSDQWDLFIKAMDDDLYKRREFKFMNPKHKDKEYIRHYLGSPVNGMALLAVGQFKTPEDFAYVWIISKSVNYGEPYLVFEKYAQSFRNPNTLAEIVERAFNWVLKGTSVKFVLEPWETDEEIMWYKDYSESYKAEAKKCKDKGPIMIGYEDMLERHLEELAREAKSSSSKNIRKTDEIFAYIWAENKEGIVEFLHQAVKGQKFAKEITRPFRLLCDQEITDKIPFRTVTKEFPELDGLLKERGYNTWTNSNSTNYDHDLPYKFLKEKLSLIL